MTQPTMLTLSHIAYTYPSAPEPLFEDVSVSLSRGWTAVLGDNGIGKSTLARVAAGLLRPDRGVVAPAPDGLAVAYCPQSTDERPGNLDDVAADWSPEAMAVRQALGIDEGWLYRYDTLSGGEAKRVQIACAMAARPDVLVLDEPSNHVDEPTRAAIVAAMRRFRGIGVLISHDVELIDATCGRCVMFERRHVDGRNVSVVTTYQGGYTQAAAQRDANDARDVDRLNAARREAARLREAQSARLAKVQRADAMRERGGRRIGAKDNDARYRLHLAKATSLDSGVSRAYAQLDGRVAAAERKAASLSVAAKRYDGDIWLDAGPSHRRELVRIGPGLIRFGGDGAVEEAAAPCRTMCPASALHADGSLWRVEAAAIPAGGVAEPGVAIPLLSLGPRDHVGLVGPNGLGKSTVVCALLRAAADVPTLVVAQDTGPRDARRALSRLRRLEPGQRARVLGAFAQLNADPERLLAGESPSPGELRKLLLCLGLLDRPQLIVMDEPTNHLDLGSKQALARVLAGYPGALVVVSHERWFVEQVTAAA
ncbi:ATP-binding cassette domain-containing protein [Bifidobacterium phasiani]|nr:ATP-binding cassette domain-containing protein [Bifidobacterium phasiani]